LTRKRKYARVWRLENYKGILSGNGASEGSTGVLSIPGVAFAMVWWWTFGSVPEVSPQELHQLLLESSKAAVDNSDSKTNGAPAVPAQAESKQELKLPFQVVDVRTAGEFERGHIAGAVNASYFPPWAFKDKLAQLQLDLAIPVCTICLSAHRSIAATKLLTQMGFSAKQLQGGMQAWRQCKLPEVGTEHPPQPPPQQQVPSQ